jgi:hypothetical protein
VIILFGIMNGGAALGFFLDMRARRHVIHRLRDPDAGFFVAPGDPDCLLWRFQLEELHDAIDAPAGSAVALSEITGIPFARLRAALPDEMVVAPMSCALGRRSCFSITGMQQALPMQRQLTRRVKKLSRSASSGAAADVPRVPDAATPRRLDSSTTVSASRARLEELVGTALVLGYIQAACLMPVVQLAQHRSAAKRYFGDARTPAGRTFDHTCTDFVTMMSPGARYGDAARRAVRSRCLTCCIGCTLQHNNIPCRHPGRQAQVAAARAHVEAAPVAGR